MTTYVPFPPPSSPAEDFQTAAMVQYLSDEFRRIAEAINTIETGGGGSSEGEGSGGGTVDGITQDQADTRYLRRSGGTLTGALTLSGAPITGLHASTKKYVDDATASIAATDTTARTAAQNALNVANAALPKAGGALTGPLTLSGAPTDDLHAATKQYADSLTAPTINFASVGSGNFDVTNTARWATEANSTSITIPTTGNWGGINVGEFSTSQRSSLHLFNFNELRALSANTYGGYVVSSISFAFAAGTSVLSLRIGRTSTNKLLVNVSAAHLDPMPLTLYSLG